MKTFIFLCISLFSISCQSQERNFLDTNKNQINTRYLCPEGYKRLETEQNSYSNFCQNLHLKKYGALSKYYNGDEKYAENTYSSVLDQDISAKDLQQCADACMRIRGEYLFHSKQYDKIHFNFLSDGKPRYYKDYGGVKSDYKNFRKYMDYVFSYANTGSLYDELKTIKAEEIIPGDVIIQKKQPFGHAIIVLDVIIDASGNKKLLLAQSYMPAQETQVLINPNSNDGSPWYDLPINDQLRTPEWDFEGLKVGRFSN